MKKFTLFLLFGLLALSARSSTPIVVSNGFAFSPASITIQEGDSVLFEISGIHTVVEVSQNTWNNNQNTQLSGGFSLPNGGGFLLPAKLTVGTHWYVCGIHNSMGMKGIIIVEANTATHDPSPGLALNLNPNPSSGKFQVTWSSLKASQDYTIDVIDINGKTVYSTKGAGDQGLNQNVEINLSGFPKGSYIVRLQDSDGIRTRKLILQ